MWGLANSQFRASHVKVRAKNNGMEEEKPAEDRRREAGGEEEEDVTGVRWCVETGRTFHRQNVGMPFQEITFTQCKRLPDTLEPLPAARTQEIQPITKVIFKEIAAEPAVNCNVFLFETRDIFR